ncbi:uncharacterized protein LOC134243594 [Saccostrea cucullata]|uniref:uncharacterized protein LOC134243594 n=1 Tax=Saccostrea cuccullata TaxID=36930 RepID=UPI002ED3B54D
MDQVPDTAQHFIECDTESCRNFSEFYCNTCHQRICDQCKQRHQEQNNGHRIVLYHERKRKLPSEKCRIHATGDLDFFCDDCHNPICSTCVDQHHSDHEISDLETIYNDILQDCQKAITEVWRKDILEAKDNVELIGKKRENVKKEIVKLRVSMKYRADELKEVVDNILIDNIKKLDEIENSVLTEMMEQQKKKVDYINYLEKLIADYESKISLIKHTELIKFHLEISLATLKMPSKSEPKLPTFTLGTLNKEEIAKQFGEIELDLSERFKLSSVIKVSEKTIPREGIFHLSLLPPNKFWASEKWGNINQYDMEGNILQKISTTILDFQGNHTVTTEEELLYTDMNENAVNRVKSDMSTDKLIETGSWEPGAIFSSPINGHILVGLRKRTKSSNNKITRYNRERTKLQDIQWDDKRKTLYRSIRFITENINGDICTSDGKARKVVVVTASGTYRFSYTGHHSQSGFIPSGICTDVLGNILVCNNYFTFMKNCFSVDMLDINGQFLSFLLTSEQFPPSPHALCIDDQHNLWVGASDSFTILVYNYLQKTEK